MLKLIKFEMKKIGIVVGIYAAIATLFNAICMIVVSVSNTSLLYDYDDTAFPLLVMILTGITLIIYYGIRSYKSSTIYGISAISQAKIIVARVLIVFGLTFFMCLLLTAEATIVGILAQKGEEITVNSYGIFCLLGAPFLSWFQPLGCALFFAWVFALSVAAKPLTNFCPNTVTKMFTIAAVMALGCFVQFYIGALFTRGCNAVDFNAFTIPKFVLDGGKTLVPTNFLYYLPQDKYGLLTPSNVSYIHFNILSLAEILFVTAQIICCVLMYSLSNVSLSKKATKSNKKQLFKLIMPACLIVFYFIFTPIVTSTAPIKKAGLYADYLQRQEIVIDNADEQPVDISQYVKFDEINNLPSYYEIVYYVDGWILDRPAEIYELYKEGIDYSVSEDYKTFFLQKRGYYTLNITVKNKFTDQAYAINPIFISFGM